jgi:ion channel
MWARAGILLALDLIAFVYNSGKPIDIWFAFFFWLAGLGIEVNVLRILLIMIKTGIGRARFILLQAALMTHVIFINSAVLRGLGVTDIANKSVIHDSYIGLYLSAITFTSLGYGDFVPATGFGRVVAATESLSGYLILAILVAVILDAARESRISYRRQTRNICDQEIRILDEILVIMQNKGIEVESIEAIRNKLEKIKTDMGSIDWT